MGDRDSVFPALRRVATWGPVRWALGVAFAAVAPYAGWWAKSRASTDGLGFLQAQIADPVQVLTFPRYVKGDDKGKFITVVTRLDGIEDRLKKCEDGRKDDAEFLRRVRLDLIGFQAATSQPRAALRAETANQARKTYLDKTKAPPPKDTDEQAAYRAALETRPPR